MGYIDLIIPLIPIFVSNLMIGSFCLKPKKLLTREERRKKSQNWRYELSISRM